MKIYRERRMKEFVDKFNLRDVDNYDVFYT